MIQRMRNPSGRHLVRAQDSRGKNLYKSLWCRLPACSTNLPIGKVIQARALIVRVGPPSRITLREGFARLCTGKTLAGASGLSFAGPPGTREEADAQARVGTTLARASRSYSDPSRSSEYKPETPARLAPTLARPAGSSPANRAARTPPLRVHPGRCHQSTKRPSFHGIVEFGSMSVRVSTRPEGQRTSI